MNLEVKSKFEKRKQKKEIHVVPLNLSLYYVYIELFFFFPFNWICLKCPIKINARNMHQVKSYKISVISHHFKFGQMFSSFLQAWFGPFRCLQIFQFSN